MNIRKYVKVMVNISVSETGVFCHKFCTGNVGEYCGIFNQTFNKKEDNRWSDALGVGELYFYNHIRVPECIEHEIPNE